MTHTTLGDISREHRRSYPSGIAIVDDQYRLTWPEFDDRVNRTAHALQSAGVAEGDRVLWLGQTSFRVFELLGACAKLGAMVCPANWRQSDEEFAFVIDDFDPKVVVWQEEEIGEAVRGAAKLTTRDPVWWQHDTDDQDSYENALAAQSTEDRWGPVDVDLPLLVIYTAAIGGKPNGSMLTHRNLLAMAHEASYLTRSNSDSVFLNSGPLFHIGNFQWDAMAVYLQGGTNVFVRRVDAKALLETITREGVTSAFLMPPTIMQMTQLYDADKHDVSRLRGGAFTPLWNGLLEQDTTPWGSAPGGFGQTEVSGLAVVNGHGGRGRGNSGRPSPLVRVRIVDTEGNEQPIGQAGEIVVAGDVVHAGYWNRPEINAQRMRDGWWHTTDLGRREPDGTIHFLGTMTRMIKSAAENIYPAEVENCLEQHPAVREAALIGVPDPQFTQAVKAVVALVDGARVTTEELIEHCRERIASYKKPRTVEFVSEIPKRDGGKDYGTLDAMFGGGGYPGGDNVRA
ncbi:AMP-binding protein [Rhodococcus sp. B50]|uniref:AMP-binding protein n=1 Tax=Rhodococcus sp. B50 TaxID=2682847 RepID=UPI001BD33D41|nr:AMP-binding protein [Rhodococcus sp. B50]MBS9376402.1 Long-chain-fatty-acid--CoA ligase [Rhodococcus sp. B50]